MAYVPKNSFKILKVINIKHKSTYIIRREKKFSALNFRTYEDGNKNI